MKRCKQRNKDGENIMLYLRTESQGFIKSNSKTKKKKRGGQNSNHGVFIFLMVHCLVISIQKNMEWAYSN